MQPPRVCGMPHRVNLRQSARRHHCPELSRDRNMVLLASGCAGRSLWQPVPRQLYRWGLLHWWEVSESRQGTACSKTKAGWIWGILQIQIWEVRPGMTCREKTCGTNCRENTCELITVPGKAWDKCTSTATKNIACEKGTACMRGIEWVGIRRCRPVGGVGAYCDSFYFPGKQRSRCRGSLKSGYSVRGDFLWKRTCYDPVKVLPPGARCNPKLSKCVARTFSRAINCSSKGSHFAFQFDAYHLDSQVEQ